MKSIPRSIYIGVLVALAVFIWGMAGYLSQVIHGTPVGVTLAEVVGMAASAAGLMGAIAWGLMAWISKRINADPEASIPLSRTPSIVSGVVLAVVAIGGATVGNSRNEEHDRSTAAATAAKAAREKAVAAEAARVATLTPDQLAAEKQAKEVAAEKTKQAQIVAAANAKAAQEAAASAASAAEAAKNLVLMKQALVVESLRSLRASMKDPDTFELKEVLMTDAGSGCITYRARNSFGAALQGHAVLSVPPAPKAGAKSKESIRFLVESQSGFSGAWNRSCANQQGEDLTRTAKRVLNWD